MKKERLKILEMLEAGKINAEEAAKLLEALKTTKDGYYWDCDDSYEIEDKLNKFAENMEQFTKDFGNKMESAYKSMEPKFKKATKSVIEKTASVIDDISKSLNESLQNMECKMDECCEDKDEDCCCDCDDDGPRPN